MDSSTKLSSKQHFKTNIHQLKWFSIILEGTLYLLSVRQVHLSKLLVSSCLPVPNTNVRPLSSTNYTLPSFSFGRSDIAVDFFSDSLFCDVISTVAFYILGLKIEALNSFVNLLVFFTCKFLFCKVISFF